MSYGPEVCRAHRSDDCKTCDEFNDDLWVHPRDLPEPHEDCRLCQLMVETRQLNLASLRHAIEDAENEIAEIERGERHNAYHEKQRQL